MEVPERLNNKLFILIALTIILIFSGILATHAAAEPPGNSSVTYLYPEGKNLILNGSTWIILDPVSDRITGDPVILSGMTNLPAGTEIEIRLTKLENATYIPSPTYGYHSSNGIARVTNGSIQDNNIFLTQIDTSSLKRGEYRITVSAGNLTGYIPDPLLLFPSESRTTIKGYSSGYSGLTMNYWLSIDPSLSKDDNSSTYTIKGTTNLPNDEELSCILLDLYPASPSGDGKSIIMDLPKKLSDYKGHVSYRKAGEPNEFKLLINDSGITAGTNWVTVWNPRYNSSDPNSFLSKSINIRDESNTIKPNSTASREENRTILLRNGSTWIRSKIICDGWVGEVLNVTGTTNLQAGEYLIGILDSWGSPLIVDTVRVENGTTPENNTFSFSFDTMKYPAGECQVHLVSPEIEGILNSFVLFGNHIPPALQAAWGIFVIAYQNGEIPGTILKSTPKGLTVEPDEI